MTWPSHMIWFSFDVIRGKNIILFIKTFWNNREYKILGYFNEYIILWNIFHFHYKLLEI